MIQTGEAPAWSVRAPLEMLDDFSSSNVHSLLYDFGENELYARYLRDGADAIYKYSGVPAQEWSGLANASSKGGYINRNIAYVYRYSKLGIGGFPDQGQSIEHPIARRFVTAPLSTNAGAEHPHTE